MSLCKKLFEVLHTLSNLCCRRSMWYRHNRLIRAEPVDEPHTLHANLMINNPDTIFQDRLS